MSALPGVASAWPGGRALVTDMRAPTLDLSQAVGQRTATYRFDLVNGVTGERLGELHPVRDASLSHDTTGAIKRRLTMNLGVSDTAAINVLTDRVELFMVIPSAPNPDRADGAWPLGRYMWADESVSQSTGGDRSSGSLSDEGFEIAQEILAGVSGTGRPIVDVILEVMSAVPRIVTKAEPTPYTSADAWSIGSDRGQILEALATAGDYFLPWMDNLGRLRFIRTFNPADAVATIDLDAGFQAAQGSPVATSDILTAPNTIIVVSNNPSNSSSACVGVASVPPSAPNSIANRGFAIPKTLNLQLSDAAQAQAVANGLIQRLAVYEQISLSTAPDPRFDSYDVVRWQGANWLDLGWSLTLTEGSPMTHTMRRAYAG